MADTIFTGATTNVIALPKNLRASSNGYSLDYDSGTSTNQLGFEDWTYVYNDSGAEIADGKPVYISGAHTDGTPTIELACACSPSEAFTLLGIATQTIANGAYGIITERGEINDINTVGLSTSGFVYLDAVAGDLTMTKPAYPNSIIIVGKCLEVNASTGRLFVQKSFVEQRTAISKSYAFTSQGISAGTYYKSGFYDYSTTDANLNQATPTTTFGIADIGYSAHPFAIFGGAGTASGGVIGLRVNGTSIDDDGNLTPGDSDILTADITQVALNQYTEGKKFVGTVTYELYTVSGTPTTYALDFNYGYAKYEDIGNQDFYLTGIECLWQGGGTDANGFDVILYKHNSSDWNYAATGFKPTPAVIAQRSTDQASFLRVADGVESAWKRTNLDTFINGSGSEGVVIEIQTGSPNTIQIMDLHLAGFLD